ncbi:helix-turn-helix transcriptional regulator [Sphingosinicella sp.]|uniref:helix-turn-helix transcriptional regulator n=1 Tax=Sphingosinicella sp. TaxID=1917971 RepID=UPI0035AEE8BA
MLGSAEFDRLGEIVSTLGSREFGPQFYGLFRDLLDVEECTVFSFPDPSNPRSLVVEGNCAEQREAARKLASDYVSGGYLNDPNVKRPHSQVPIDIYITEADNIFNDEYRRHYYDTPELSHELVVLGNASGTLYYTSFYRKKHRHEFGESEIEIMSLMAGFMIKALHRHSELVRHTDSAGFNFIPSSSGETGEMRQKTLEHLKNVLVAGPHKLSQREAEVCAGIVMGYSTEAISLNCSISTNTVATHRKRAYAKLGISSQNELFLRYFLTVREFQSGTVQ